MPLVSSALDSAFQPPKKDAATALLAFKSAWEAAFQGAIVGSSGIPPGGLSGPLSAMNAGLLAMFVPSGTAASAAAAVQAGVGAFWTALLAASPTIFTTPPPAPIVLVPGGTPSPGVATIGAALTTVFTSNALVKDPVTAAVAITGAIAPALIGGTVLGSVPPAAPAPIPIL